VSSKISTAATGNSNYGWFGGGSIPAVTATVDRIDFSNDSVSASPRGPLSQQDGDQQQPPTHQHKYLNYIILYEFIIQSFDCTKGHQSRRY
jgi:hypothetical protein